MEDGEMMENIERYILMFLTGTFVGLLLGLFLTVISISRGMF